ncbi:MAG: maltose alpha-D-glucosyltransferase [Thaumarchaeota archaeon]|nr:maltose alpha-D-glucosyltransferase [Nitrososphaerota archaeon]
MTLVESQPANDPLWYKDAIVYEVHVKAFCDSTGDGIGDFRGLMSKLDYIKELGATAIWVLPFYPSPLRDDGYDIADYMQVHPSYGTLKDFRDFLREAHKRGLRVITELVLNHTSDQHPWFQESRRAEPGSEARNLYVWSVSPEKYKEARIIFKDFESSNWAWDPEAGAYYWHRFYSHQPDLNFDNPRTQKLMLETVAFWLRMGVDGLRLDAVPYLFERDGTNCENLPETHSFLKRLRSYIDGSFENRMLLAEANQWPTDAVNYFGNGDECQMAFHFPLMPRMFMAIQMEDRFPVVDILEQTPSIPQNCQWATFLRNHDELTLEMVTDEERDYMYRVYGQDKQARLNLGIRRRLAPLLDNDRKKIELINVLLFTLPGTPVIYYGDEIGMGDNYYLGDRNGVRTPMQWSADTNAGFSKTNPQKLYLPVIIEPRYHYTAINVENQENDPASLLLWMRRLISIRKHYKALGRGKIEFLFPDNWKIITFTRNYEGEVLLVAASLSKYSQAADVDLSKYEGYVPRDVFGGIVFPDIGKSSYRLTFPPYGYFVFSLTKREDPSTRSQERVTSEFGTLKKANDVFRGKWKEKLEGEILPDFLRRARWFGGKARVIERTRIRDVIPFEPASGSPLPFTAVVVDVYYAEGLPEAYLLPVAYASAEKSTEVLAKSKDSVLARVTLEKESPGVIFDATQDPRFREQLLHMIAKRRTAKGTIGEITGSPRQALAAPDGLPSQLLGAEQSNSSVVFGDKFILKLFRRVEEGVNPEVEMGDFLTKQSFPAAPALFGDLQYRQPGSEPATIGMLQELIRNEGDAWSLFTIEFANFLERAASYKGEEVPEVARGGGMTAYATHEALWAGTSETLNELVGITFLEKVGLLGKRTAELHLVLARDTEDSAFRPEPFTQLYQVALSQSMISYANRVLRLVAAHPPADARSKTTLDNILSHQGSVLETFNKLRHTRIDALRTRIHGDYHLSQVLHTGKDFRIIDFEGEPARSITDRRIKRSPMKDVTNMIRSFHYAAYFNLLREGSTALTRGLANLEGWAEAWYKCVSAAFMKSYLSPLSETSIYPKDHEALEILFDSYLLEKALYELSYEMNNRPNWVMLPLHGIASFLLSEAPGGAPPIGEPTAREE